MLNKAKELSKGLVGKAIPNGKDVFHRFMCNGIENSTVEAVIDVVVNDDSSISIVVRKESFSVVRRVDTEGNVKSETKTSINIDDTLKQKIDKDLYIVKELPMCNYICMDKEGNYWGMSLVNDTLNISEIGKFDNLIDNLDSKEWGIERSKDSIQCKAYGLGLKMKKKK